MRQIAARTKQLQLILTIILPFYDVARLAEDMSVLDHISAGQATYMFGIGYLAEEYDHFGLSLSDRGQLADENLGLLRRLFAGEEVEHDGGRMKVTPPPRTPQGPAMSWGLGGSPPRAAPRPRFARQRRGAGCEGSLRGGVPTTR